MLSRERLEAIKQISISDRRVYVSNLSERFKVTKETIRRDLEKLEKQGIVTRSHGGAIVTTENSKQDKFWGEIDKEKNAQNKKCIAGKAIELINKYSSVYADSSSIALEVLRLISNRSDLTIITNSIVVLHELIQSELNIIATGGNVNFKSLSFEGSVTRSTIKRYNVDMAIVSCKGMDINKGVMDSNEDEVEIKRAMIKQAKKVILLVDQTAFDTTSFVKLFEFKDIDYIVTDKEPRKEWMKLFMSKNIKIVY